jgi:glycine cleavage system regulatory protein
MKAFLVLTVIGPDRPGLVETLATTVSNHGGNWEQSRMAHLGGQFAGILRVSLPTDRLGELHAALATLEGKGLRVVSEASSVPEPRSLRAYRLEVVGNDREGIVRDLSRALATQGVNVEQLDTSCQSAPMSGEMLFHAEAVLHVPQEVDIETLRHKLEATADDLMVDVALLPLEEHTY